MRFDKAGFLQAESKMPGVPVGSWKHRKNSNLLKHTPESIRMINTIKERKNSTQETDALNTLINAWNMCFKCIWVVLHMKDDLLTQIHFKI